METNKCETPEIRKTKKYVDYVQQIESIMDSIS